MTTYSAQLIGGIGGPRVFVTSSKSITPVTIIYANLENEDEALTLGKQIAHLMSYGDTLEKAIAAVEQHTGQKVSTKAPEITNAAGIIEVLAETLGTTVPCACCKTHRHPLMDDGICTSCRHAIELDTTEPTLDAAARNIAAWMADLPAQTPCRRCYIVPTTPNQEGYCADCWEALNAQADEEDAEEDAADEPPTKIERLCKEASRKLSDLQEALDEVEESIDNLALDDDTADNHKLARRLFSALARAEDTLNRHR